MRVLLVDDHRLLVEGLTSLLLAHGVEVAGVAYDGRQGVELALSLRPDVILMDISMPECDGLAATRLIGAAWEEARIVILTTSADEQDLFEAVRSGACGYLLKTMRADDLVEALQQAVEGIPPFSPGLARKLLEEFARLARGERPLVESQPISSAEPVVDRRGPAQLNERQREVLALVAEGLSYKEVGARLNLSSRTIKYHMREILAALHLEHRAQVLAYAGRMGLGPPP